MDYDDVAFKADERGLYNPCGIIAIALGMELEFNDAYALAVDNSYDEAYGMMTYSILNAFTSRGFELKQVKNRNNSKCKFKSIKTPVSMIRELRKSDKKYLCFVKGHVFVFSDGKVQDCPSRKSTRLMSIYEITPINDRYTI